MKIANLTKVFILLTIMTLIECSMGGFIGFWREYFWSAVSNHQHSTFVLYLVYFSIAALIACLVSGYGQYLANYASLVLRHKLTRKAFKLKDCRVENLPQRIQEDCFSYNQLMIGLIVGYVRNITMFIVYGYILIHQLGGIYLTYPILYTILGTLIAMRLAKPLVNLNYINQNVEAKFRQYLTKVNYASVHRNNHNLFKTTKYLQYFQSFYGQISVIIPYIILAPAYFSFKITFGILMQASAAINTIIECLSFTITSFNDFNRFLSCRRRLKEIRLI